MSTRLRPPGSGARARPYGLGDGARLRRDRSLIADAQRRYNAGADEDDVLGKRPLSDSPSRSALRRTSPPIESALTPLSHQARALYEGRVVPVRALARLCGVSLRTLYYHVHKQGWRRRRSDVPRDLAKSERRKARYRALKAEQPVSPRGLKARDPAGQARALAAAERAGALAGAALAKAIARQDAEAQARMLALLTRALRDLAVAKGLVEPRAVGSVRTQAERKPRQRPYQFRAIGEVPVWAERKRR